MKITLERGKLEEDGGIEFLWIWVAILGTISRRKNRKGELTQSWAWRSVGGKLRRVSFGARGKNTGEIISRRGAFAELPPLFFLDLEHPLTTPLASFHFASSTPFSSGSSRLRRPITFLSRPVNGASNVHRVISQISLANI